MLKIIDTAEEISFFLDSQPSSVIQDYRITVKISMEIDVVAIVLQKSLLEDLINKQFPKIGLNTNVLEFYPEEIANDRYLEWIFTNKHNKHKIDLGVRRRLNNLIDSNKPFKIEQKPVVTTFYSYKGGMGRSTTLAAFACFCSKIKGKRVVVVDCDFEAPGFTNYFDLDEEVLSQKNGVVEYLLDKQFIQNLDEELDIATNYSYKVGYEYVGNGEIYIIPAGNLSGSSVDDRQELSAFKNEKSSHRSQYLEGLARLDISSVENIVNQFTDFIDDLKKQLNPDIILFDSRTGFNDIFGVLSGISEVIVGFFGNNIQNRTGLEQFLDSFGTTTSTKDIILVNSIISGLEYFESFKSLVYSYLDNNQDTFVNNDEKYSSIKDFKIHYVKRDDILQRLGTDFAFKMTGPNQKYDANFVDLIEQNIFFQPLFNDIFNSINQHLDPIQRTNNVNEDSSIYSVSDIKERNTDETNTTLSKTLELNKYSVPVLDLRKKVLKNLNENIPSRYGDDEIPKISDFYFRDCMKDMFNRDKFLIIGSKGTGKTFLYQAFRKQELRSKLEERSNITMDKHLFVNVISVHNEENANKYLETTQFNVPQIDDPDFFFTRFWIVYVWNAVMLDESIRESKYFSDIVPVLPITQEPETVQRFTEIINNESSYRSVFGVLKDLDIQLRKDDKNLIILFEQLDYIVKPEYWPQAISPLINFWRSNPFSKILPKLFLRSDLFNKLTNVTNIQNLSSRAIDIEWTKKELFAYFFKILFQHSKIDFYLLIFAHFDFENENFLLDLDKVISENDNQVPTDEKYLRPLVEAFFGKYANWDDVTINSNFGESYDWFERNLKDGNEKISLRPFLNLIEKATEEFLKRHTYAKNKKSVLPASFYADYNVREFAVQQHYEDLAREKGNRALLKFYQYITVDGPTRLKIPTFRRAEFNEVLNHIFTKYKGDSDLIEINKTDDLKYILISNGIIKETDNTNRAYTNYVIPFLYRSYFRVSRHNLSEDRKREK